jgi:hypothetical protein
MGWDYDKIIETFNHADTEAIGKIKLPSRRSKDFLAWPHEKSCAFTVRSAYNLGLMQRDLNDCTTSSSMPDGERKLWSNLWKGGVPPKVKVFTWKLATNALPTRCRKFTRKMEQADTCLATVWLSRDELPCNGGVPTSLSPETSHASTLGTP